MRDAVVNALIAGLLALLGAVFGVVVTLRLQRRAEERAARDRLQVQAEALVSAVMDIRLSAAIHDAGWHSRKTRLQVLGLALLEIVPMLGRRDSVEFGRAMARSAGVAWEWNLRSLASRPQFGEATARMTSAAFALSLWPAPEVPDATRRLTDAVLADDGSTGKAEELDQAMAVFRKTIAEATNAPRPRRMRPSSSE